MIVSWNLRGINKIIKTKEVSSRLLNHNPMIYMIIETRVKMSKDAKIRDHLKLKGLFIDNYSKHDNGRIWIWWNNIKVEIKKYGLYWATNPLWYI